MSRNRIRWAHANFGLSANTKMMESYNCLILYFGHVELTIGRPFIPLYNKCMARLKTTRIYKIKMYYNASKAQIDCDLEYAGITQASHRLESLKKSYTIGLEMREYIQYVPYWLLPVLERKLEIYYEKQMLKRRED